MAQVDFSNAIIEQVGNSTKPFNASYVYLNYANYLRDSYGNTITTGTHRNILSQTATKVSIVYDGQFTASGTEFYLPANNAFLWRVRNISFSAGDTYNFQIDIELSVS